MEPVSQQQVLLVATLAPLSTERRETPFTLAEKNKLTKEKTEECHRVVTVFSRFPTGMMAPPYSTPHHPLVCPLLMFVVK